MRQFKDVPDAPSALGLLLCGGGLLAAAVTSPSLAGLFLSGSLLLLMHLERQARRREARISAILESMTDGFFALDRDWRFTDLNRRAELLLRRTRAELLGKRVWDVFPEARGSVFQVEYERALTTQGPVHFEALYSPLDAWFSVLAVPSADGLSVYFLDVTERRRGDAARQALLDREREARAEAEAAREEARRANEELIAVNRALQHRVIELQTLLDVIPIGIAVAEDPECRRIIPNPALAALLGVPPGTNFSKSAPSHEQPAFKLYRDGRELSPDELTLQYAVRHGVTVRNAELDIVWPDGRSRRLLEWATPIFDEQGRVRGGFLAVVDITERNRAEMTARRLAAIVESSIDAIVGTTVDGVITSWNAAVERMYGYTAEEAVGRSIALLLPPDRAHEVPDMVGRLRRGERIEDFETVGLRKDGSWLDLSLTVSPVLDDAGRVTGASVIARDVTRRKCAEEALRESEARLQAILDNSPALIYLKDTAGRYLLVNRRFESLLGVKADQVLGKTAREIFTTAAGDAIRANDEEVVRTGGPLEFEEVFEHEGKARTFISVKFPIFDPTGAMYAVCGISTDVTERKQLEEELRQAQKMEAVGRLAGGVAHDFNNLLTVITGYSELLLEALGSDSPLRKDVEEIRGAAARASSLTRQLLAFSRQQVLQPRVLDVNVVVADMAKMLERLIGEDIELDARLHPGLWPVKADHGQLEQVILNLAVNARDAMPGGGKLTLETANVELDEAYARQHVSIQPGYYVMIAVTDTGCGMTPEVQTRIFEPFFTTKEPGKGTGLGLSTVYGIVKQSGGHIQVHGEPGRGTTFKIYLPRAEDHVGVCAPTAAPASVAGGSETILLVEDDEGVRSLAQEVLERKGYTVLLAHRGDDALAICKQHGGEISLMLTDLVMPGMGGREAAEQASSLQPGMKIVYMSGYTHQGLLQQQVFGPGTAFLPKPFGPDALARKVREVLDTEQRGPEAELL